MISEGLGVYSAFLLYQYHDRRRGVITQRSPDTRTLMVADVLIVFIAVRAKQVIEYEYIYISLSIFFVK